MQEMLQIFLESSSSPAFRAEGRTRLLDSTQVLLAQALQTGKTEVVNLKFWDERRGSGSTYCSPRKHLLHVVWNIKLTYFVSSILTYCSV